MRKVIINFSKDFQLYKACANPGEYRPVLEYIQFKGGNAYATNGHIAVRVPVSSIAGDMDGLENLEGKYIHKAIYKKILSHSIVKITPEGIVAIEPEYEILYRYAKDDFECPMPDIENTLKKATDVEPTEEIAISTQSLDNLSKAMGAEFGQLRLEFSGAAKAIRVFPNQGENRAQGVIMPAMIFKQN